MRAETSKKKIFMTFDFDASLISKARLIGMKYRPKTYEWWLHDNYVNRLMFNREFPGLIDVESFLPLDNYKIPTHITSHPDGEIFKFMNHQREAVEDSIFRRGLGIFHDCGVGKCLTTIEIIKMYGVKVLVVCPLSIIESGWMSDLGRWAPELRRNAVNLWKLKGNKKKFAEALKKDICIINYESFKTKIDQIKDAGFKMVVCDESSKLKTLKKSKTNITNVMLDYCNDVPLVFLLSGTPAPNTKLEYFSQISILDPSLFGRSFYAFREKYFYRSGFGGFKWKEKEEMVNEFMDKVSSVSVVARKEDVLDLPPRTEQTRDVILSADEKRVYAQMKSDMIVEINDKQISAQNAAVKFMKLRQVTSGFIFDEDKAVITIGTSKLKALLEVLSEIGSHQVIIWQEFHYEAASIKKALGSDSAICNGTVSEKEVQENIKIFKAGGIKYLICQPKKVGHGHTFVNAMYSIYYSISCSQELRGQSVDRNYRIGQKNDCTVYYLIAPDSIDVAMLEILNSKKNSSDIILDYIYNRNKGGK